MQIAHDVAVGAGLLSLGLYVIVSVASLVVLAWKRRRPAPRRQKRARDGLVTIMKPLAGADDELGRNLDSFANLRGARYEILFGIASLRDPARAAAEAFLARHPDVAARIVVTDRSAATNPKVAQLIGLVAEARGELLVISDSNVCVGPDYLEDLLDRLDEEGCGLVTHLIAGTGEQTIGAALENLQLAALIAPSVVLSSCSRYPVTVGKSMAMRRADLEKVGGLRSFGDFLAEDYMLGRRFVEHGFRVITSFEAIENRNVDTTLARTFERHTRWTKMRRAMHPSLIAFEPLLAPVVIAVLGVGLVPSPSTAAVLGVSVVAQTALALVGTYALRGRALPWRYAPLEVARSFFMIVCWLSAWWSLEVNWRGHRRLVGPETRLSPARPRRRLFGKPRAHA